MRGLLTARVQSTCRGPRMRASGSPEARSAREARGADDGPGPGSRPGIAFRPAGAPGGRRTAAARPIRACRSGWWRATRGRGSPARCAGPRRPRAGAWPRYGAGRAAPASGTDPAAAILACTTRRAVRGSRRPPRAPRYSAAPDRSVASSGRPASCHRRTAAAAGMPIGHHPLLAALAQNAHGPAPVVDVADIEPAQFADPDAGRVEEFHDRACHATRARPRAVPRAASGAASLAASTAAICSWRQHVRQVTDGLGRAEQRPGVAVQPARASARRR